MTTSALSELSILIVTWKGDDLLKNCLESLRRACGEVPEIVVVDNANLASTKALVAAYPNATYIAAPENLGFAGGNNLGLPLCTRPYVLLLNNDTIVHEEPFTQLIQYLKSHPKVAVVQGKMRLVRFGDVLDECGSLLTPAGILYQRHLHEPASTPVTSGAVFQAKGACLMFPRILLQKLGGTLFYNGFKSYYEDTDFCHRVWLTGREVHFVDTPPIDHLCGQTASKLNNIDVAIQSFSNHLFSYFSLFERKTLLTLIPKFLGIHLLIALRFALVGNFKPINILVRAFHRTRMRHKEITHIRTLIQNNRVITDRELFKFVMADVGPSFYWHWARGPVK